MFLKEYECKEIDEFSDLLREYPLPDELKELPPMTNAQLIFKIRNVGLTEDELRHISLLTVKAGTLREKGYGHHVRKIYDNFRYEDYVIYMRIKILVHTVEVLSSL